jgi:hypothetical protein
LTDWVEKDNFQAKKNGTLGRKRGKMYSPHSINGLGGKIIPKWGGIIHIGSLYYFSTIAGINW